MRATVRNLFLVLLLCTKAPIAWGFFVSDSENLTQQVLQSELWNHPQWIKLGHYEKKIFGYSSPFTKGFFLSTEGANSPKKELLKTIDVLFNQDKKQQCKYLARTAWLKKTLNIPESLIDPCHDINQWKKTLNAKSVALIFAASDLGNASSSFGHTFLKIINPNNSQNKDLIDYGINYAANTRDEQGLFYAIKGLLGSYPGQFTMLPYHQKIREYLNLEGRDIWEYHLNFTPEEVDFLVDHLLEMEGAEAPYYFFSDNCSYQILKSIEVVRPHLHLSDDFKYFVIPIDTVKKLNSLSLDEEFKIIDHVQYKKSLKTDYLDSYAQLGFLQKKVLGDVVDNLKISTDVELSNTEKAEVLETAMKYLSIKSYRSGKDLEDDKYKLYLERVSLGPITNEKPLLQKQPPEESHDSSALSIGFGFTDRNQNTPFSSIKFRNALHELEQTDFGTVPFSHNEMGSLEIRYIHSDPKNQNQKINRIDIYSARLLKLVNLNPVTQLDRPFSWKVTADILTEWKTFFEGGFGYSYDVPFFNRSRINYFLTARSFSDYDPSGDYKYINAVGPEIMWASYLQSNIGLSVNINYLFSEKSSPLFLYSSKINFSLKRNFDLQFSVHNKLNQDLEYQSNFVWNFIF